ncbi:MAG: type VI secretion system contractile sheath large subunit [Syntrophales bacterium]|jgi:type VI secretion system protein ImpC|nr:type VI secretion system contractile sheath large subunit [Syntrophales bacterium]
MKTIPPPYTILALGPFSPVPETGFPVNIIPVETPTLQETFGQLSPRLWIPAPTDICPAGGLTLQPSGIRDLTPDGLIRTTSYLKDLCDAGEFIAKGHTSGATPADIAAQVQSTWPHLPLDLSIPTIAAQQATRHNSAVDDILSMVAMPDRSTPGGPRSSGGPADWKRQIDGLLSANIGCIFNNKEFRAFEAAWRGVECLVRRGGVKEIGKIVLKIIPASTETLTAVLESLSIELAEDSPDLILIDLPLDNTPGGVEMLGKIAAFATTLLIPAATWITPAFFHLDNWRELHRLSYLKHHLDDAVYAKWRKLREQPSGQWLALTCNRFLTRAPYGENNRPRSVAFTETEPLWISPVWALGTLAAQSVNQFGWPSRLTDYMRVRMKDLAVSDQGDETTAATETIFPDDRIRQFMEIGVTPLAGASGQDTAFMPKAAVASGESLLSQMLLSRIIGFLIRLRDAYEESDGETEPVSFVSEALMAFFEATGQEPPDDLWITVGPYPEGHKQEGEASLPLDIAFTPPKAVSPDSRKLAFTFSW